MILRINPFRGIFTPAVYRGMLAEAEHYKRYRLSIILLYLASILIYMVGSSLGIGSESISKELPTLTDSAFEARKQLFLIGKLLQALIIPTIFLYLSSLYYVAFANGQFRKMMIMQMNVLGLFLIEKLLLIPLFLGLNIGSASNVFSFGVIAQYITSNVIAIDFLSELTIFRVAMFFLSYFYLTKLIEGRKQTLFVLNVILYVIYWIFAGFISYMKIEFFF